MKKLLTLLMLVVCSIGSAWADDVVLFSADFSSSEWAGTQFKSGETTNGIYVLGDNCSISADGVLTFPTANNYSTSRFLAITLTGIKGKFTVTVNTNAAQAIKYEVTEGSTISCPGKPTISDKASPIVLEYTMTGDGTDAVFYFGRNSSSYGSIVTGITITTPEEVEEVPVQEIASVSFSGKSLSETDLATLKADNAVTIDGSELNGLPMISVGLTSGVTSVTRTIESGNAIFKFTINATEEYTITITNVVRTYEKEGVVIAYKEGETDATGQDTNTLSLNGITFEMVDTGKKFQYGTGAVTLGETEYQPIKLSTGSGVNVTLPEGKVAKKIIIYGWSASNDGRLKALSESENSEKSVDVLQDIYYAGNAAEDIYPSVYSYDVDNWESIYFNAGGSPSQPFIVMDIVFAEEAPAPVTLNASGYATYSNENTVTLDGATAYVASVDEANNVVKLTSIGNVVPAQTGVLLVGEAGATVNVELGGEAPVVEGNDFKAALTADETSKLGNVYVLSGSSFVKYTGATLSVNKAYLVMSENFGSDSNAAPMRLVFGEDTGISEVNAAATAVEAPVYNLNGQRVNANAKGLLIKNGKKYINK